VTMPFYASVEQVMRDRSELARKGIARGRGVAVLSYSRGVLFVAENLSTALHKVSEIYDRIGFAAVGRYNEYENLRQAGIRHADFRGYSYDRRDVTGRGLANAYAQTLGTIFSEQQKPFEVELCVAEVGADTDSDQLYHLTYDGSIVDEPDFVVMGGQADVISTALKESFRQDMDTAEAVAAAVAALSSVSTNVNGAGKRILGVGQLEVAVLDRSRPRRAFRRITGAALTALLTSTDASPTEESADPPPPDAGDDGDGANGAPASGEPSASS
jgi:proteasome alpha subunit